MWALVRAPLIADSVSGYGIDRWRDWYGASRIINSSYRNPVRNVGLTPSGAANSRHMFGDAADLRNETYTENEWTAMHTAAANANADYIEPRDGPCGLVTRCDVGNHRRDRAVDQVNVGQADPACVDLDQDVERPRLGDGHLFDLQLAR